MLTSSDESELELELELVVVLELEFGLVLEELELELEDDDVELEPDSACIVTSITSCASGLSDLLFCGSENQNACGSGEKN